MTINITLSPKNMTHAYQHNPPPPKKNSMTPQRKCKTHAYQHDPPPPPMFLFLDFGQGLLCQTTCLYQAFIIQPVVFIHICGLGGII